MIYTFWEGDMPEYIRLCLQTWKLPYTLLTYKDIDIEGTRRFSLAQQADVIRVHILRDRGGYWLDADTIMLTDHLPEGTVTGTATTNTIGFLHASEPHEPFFEEWAAYQDQVLADPNASHHWSVMGNRFTDKYMKTHDVSIADVRRHWPETYTIKSGERYGKYLKFYFDRSYHLSDIEPTDLIMLHNSWTPKWYKALTNPLDYDCTLSNFLREAINGS